MPTVSVYIKNEDWEAWRSLKKPSEFIHNALNEGSYVKRVKQVREAVPELQKQPKPKKVVEAPHQTFFKKGEK